MGVAAQYAETHATHSKVLADLKAALAAPGTPEDEKPGLQDRIDTFEYAIAELENTDPPPPPPPKSMADEIVHHYYPPSGEPWQSDRHYAEGDTVTHAGKTWVALPDVAVGQQPDEIFDADANTGGWRDITDPSQGG